MEETTIIVVVVVVVVVIIIFFFKLLSRERERESERVRAWASERERERERRWRNVAQCSSTWFNNPRLPIDREQQPFLPFHPFIPSCVLYPSTRNVCFGISATRVPCQNGSKKLVDWAVISCVHRLKITRKMMTKYTSSLRNWKKRNEKAFN